MSLNINNLNVNNDNSFTFKNSSKINIRVNNVSTYDDYEELNYEPTKYPVVRKSTTPYSDKDNIYINHLADYMVDLKNSLKNLEKKDGIPYYSIYNEWCKGKKINEIVNTEDGDNQGHYYNIDKDDEYFNEILIKYGLLDQKEEILNNINDSLNKNDINISDVSSSMLESTIEEVVITENGYDCMVLKDKDGNYLIINSSTNPNTIEDIAAIAYAMSHMITGNDDLTNLIFNEMLQNGYIHDYLDNTMFDLTNYNSVNNYCKECYEGQVNDNMAIIEKYASQGNVILNGYSLGGGIQETTYAKILAENPEYAQNIIGVSVYNPYTLYAEEYNKEYISLLANDPNFVIYAAEEDYVSTFNNSVSELLGVTNYIQSTNLTEVENFSILYLASLITTPSGNHGFSHNNDACFDSEGNLIYCGNYVSINQSISNVSGSDNPTSDAYDLNFNLLFNEILYSLNFNPDKIDEDYQKLVKDLIKYFNDNLGDIKYEKVVDILVDNIWIIIEKKINKLSFNNKYLSSLFKNEQLFKDTLRDFLLNPDIKEKMIELLGLYLDKDEEKLAETLVDIINSFIQTYFDNCTNDLQTSNLANIFGTNKAINEIANLLFDNLINLMTTNLTDEQIAEIKEEINNVNYFDVFNDDSTVVNILSFLYVTENSIFDIGGTIFTWGSDNFGTFGSNTHELADTLDIPVVSQLLHGLGYFDDGVHHLFGFVGDQVSNFPENLNDLIETDIEYYSTHDFNDMVDDYMDIVDYAAENCEWYSNVLDFTGDYIVGPVGDFFGWW